MIAPGLIVTPSPRLYMDGAGRSFSSFGQTDCKHNLDGIGEGVTDGVAVGGCVFVGVRLGATVGKEGVKVGVICNVAVKVGVRVLVGVFVASCDTHGIAPNLQAGDP